jgi:hypothetical protein
MIRGPNTVWTWCPAAICSCTHAMSRARVNFCAQRDGAPLALDGRDDKVQVHIQAQLEDVAHCRIASRCGGARVVGVMKGWVVFVFHMQQRVPRRPTPGNPSWHLTRPARPGCNPRLPRAGSLSLGREATLRTPRV